MTIELSSQIFEKCSNIKYNDSTPVWKPSCSTWGGGRLGGQTDTDKQTDRYSYGEGYSRFSQFGNSPKTPFFNTQNWWDSTPFFLVNIYRRFEGT
jgi:hypothetical protein